MAVELRRALLLFAIVLGIAAIATSLSGPADRDETSKRPSAVSPTPSAAPQPAVGDPAAIFFSSTGKARTLRLEAGRPAVVTVDVARPGQIELPGLGLSGTAEPLTAARFDVFERRPGRYDVRFISAKSGEARTVGKLQIVP